MTPPTAPSDLRAYLPEGRTAIDPDAATREYWHIPQQGPVSENVCSLREGGVPALCGGVSGWTACLFPDGGPGRSAYDPEIAQDFCPHCRAVFTKVFPDAEPLPEPPCVDVRAFRRDGFREVPKHQLDPKITDISTYHVPRPGNDPRDRCSQEGRRSSLCDSSFDICLDIARPGISLYAPAIANLLCPACVREVPDAYPGAERPRKPAPAPVDDSLPSKTSGSTSF